jgi:DegV family protein with EDD domain
VESEKYRFCTEALVRGEEFPAQKVVRDRLREVGDSLIVLVTGTMLKVHIHTDEPDAVFDYLKSYGSLAAHKSEDMHAQNHVAARRAGGHLTMVRRPVGIVTDSAADLPEDVIRAHGIQVVPCVLVEGENIYRDGVDITAEEYHQRLTDGGELPTTSQPPPGAFLEAYRRAAESAEEVVAVIVGSNLSGTFASAEAAASRLDSPITLVDSLGISLLQGLLVLKATELAELATPPADIAAELARIRRQSGILFTVDRFDRLLASGRVGRGQAWLGTVLGVKPILSLDVEGKIVPLGKAIGRKRVVPALIRAMIGQIPPGATKIRFGIVHVARPNIVEQASEVIRARFGDVEILSAPVTPVIATHLGVGGWGAGFIVED